MNQKYLLNPDDLVSLRVAMDILLDRCETAIRENKTLPISEGLYDQFQKTQENTKYNNLEMIMK